MKKKNKQLLNLSLLLICILLGASSFNKLSTKALLDENQNQYSLNSIDRSSWEWSSTEVISTDSSEDSYMPVIVVDSLEKVHITWFDNTNYSNCGTDKDIFYKNWDESTSIWSTTEVVSTESTEASYSPVIAADSLGNIHIAWEDFTNYAGAGPFDSDIFYKRWVVENSSWTTTEVVSTESGSYSRFPSLDVDSMNNVHIAWEDNTDYNGAGPEFDIFYKRWNATTLAWTTTEVVSTESIGNSFAASLALDTNYDAHIAWYDESDYDDSGTDTDIFYKWWDSQSTSWNPTEVVSTESTNSSEEPDLTVDISGNIHVAWMDLIAYDPSGDDWDIFYKRWNSSDSSWTASEEVSTGSTIYSLEPSLVADITGDIHITWEESEEFEGSGPDNDIMYRRLDISSSSWSALEVVSTESTAYSQNPSIAINNLGYIHIVWDDHTDYSGSEGDRDIFYKFLASPPHSTEKTGIDIGTIGVIMILGLITIFIKKRKSVRI